MIRIFTSPSQQIGESGERIAAAYLTENGFLIIDRNVPNKFGEIDIVAKKEGIVYFFEVKTGKIGSGISPAENFTPSKIRKILISVQHYALLHQIKEYQVEGVIVQFSYGRRYTIERISLF